MENGTDCSSSRSFSRIVRKVEPGKHHVVVLKKQIFLTMLSRLMMDVVLKRELGGSWGGSMALMSGVRGHSAGSGAWYPLCALLICLHVQTSECEKISLTLKRLSDEMCCNYTNNVFCEVKL